MSHFRLRKGLSFCRIGPAIVLLDIPHDKYRMLGASLTGSFIEFLNGTLANADRLERAGVIERGGDNTSPRAALIDVALSQHPACAEGRFRVLPTIAAIQGTRRVQRMLSGLGLEAVLKTVRSSPAKADNGHADERAVCKVLRAFEHSRYWMASAELCLPRSIALLNMLSARRFRAELILGVRLDPFRAHSWVQAGTVVLSDSAEEVAKFTPILVL